MASPEADHSWLVNTPTTADEVRAHYDGWVDTYDATLASWRYDAPRRVAMAVHEAAGATASVLDAGCGTGLVAIELRALGHTGAITGIDLSPRSIEHARQSGHYTRAEVADLLARLPFDDGWFDAVTCVGVLTYVPDTRAIWGEFCRVTRPGGTIALTQRSDAWDERGCATLLDEFERAGRLVVAHLSEPTLYMPGNPDFADQILVRYLVARVRHAER